jgi:hypothetical protein
MIGDARPSRWIAVILLAMAWVIAAQHVAAGAPSSPATPSVSVATREADAGAESDPSNSIAALLRAAQASYDRGVALRRSDPDGARRAFDDAAAGFSEALREIGPNGWLWFNLGNAQLQNGRVGEAIVALRSAQQLLGAAPQVEGTLAYARSLRQDQIPATGAGSMLRQVLDARHLLSPRVRLGVALLANAIFWGLLTIRLLRPVSWTLIVVAGLATMLFGATIALDARAARRLDDGVLIADEVVLRTGNGDGFSTAINERLGAGVELIVVEERPGWLHVRLPDGTEGWVREELVGRVRPDLRGTA